MIVQESERMPIVLIDDNHINLTLLKHLVDQLVPGQVLPSFHRCKRWSTVGRLCRIW